MTLWAWASMKTIPSRAIRSRFGVPARDFPEKPGASARSVSIVTRMTSSFGAPANGFEEDLRQKERAAKRQSRTPNETDLTPGSRHPLSVLRRGGRGVRSVIRLLRRCSLQRLQEFFDRSRVLAVRIQRQILFELGLAPRLVLELVPRQAAVVVGRAFVGLLLDRL